MPKCPNCENGYREVIEDGRRFLDACYHCGNTGYISENQLESDRIRWAAEVVAGEMVSRAEAWANANPTGEGWAFHAAENMCSVYEYTEGRWWGYVSDAMNAFAKIDNDSVRGLVLYLLTPDADPKTVNRTAVEAIDILSVKEVVLDRLDGKVFSISNYCWDCGAEGGCVCPPPEPDNPYTHPSPALSHDDDEIPF